MKTFRFNSLVILVTLLIICFNVTYSQNLQSTTFSQVFDILNVSVPPAAVLYYLGSFDPKLPKGFFSQKSEDWATARNIIADPMFLNSYQTKLLGRNISLWIYLAHSEYEFYGKDTTSSPPSIDAGGDLKMLAVTSKYGNSTDTTSFTFSDGKKVAINWYGPIFFMVDENNSIQSLGGFPSLLMGDEILMKYYHEDIKARMSKIKEKLVGPSIMPETDNEQAAKISLPFVEKSRIMITQNTNGTLNFKNIGGEASGIKAEISLKGSGMTVTGFNAGTLLVIDTTDLTISTVFDRAEYKIECTNNIQKGTMIEVRIEGKISPNLRFVRNGTVLTDFTAKDSTGNTVVSNKRTIEIKNGKVKKVFFEDMTKPKELNSISGKLVDLQSMTFDFKKPKGTQSGKH